MADIQTMEQAQAYIESLLSHGSILKGAPGYKKPTLERMRALLGLMGNPQNKYPTIHIGGTAGKGSTATLIAHTLTTAGYKTGLHVSPHLQDIRERLQINEQLVPDDQFVEMVAKLQPIVEKLSADYSFGPPSYFEVLLALAFQHFAQQQVDIAVVEVGLGGTLDGTNVITPICSVLTNVSLDHTEILGNTVEKIARDKVGIFKKGIPVVSGVTQPSVRQIVQNKANEVSAPLQFINELSYKIITQSKVGTIFDIKLPKYEDKNIHLSLLGKHQVQNAAVACAVFATIKNRGFAIDYTTVRKSFSTITIPGRAEIVNKTPIVTLDGAHNPAKMHAFVTTVKTIFPHQKSKVIFAAKKGKNVKTMLAILNQITDKYFFTQFQSTTDFGKNQSMTPNDIASLTTKPYEIFQDPRQAYKAAIAQTSPTDIICATGSLYLVGELRTHIHPIPPP